MSSGISEEGVLRKLVELMNAHVPCRRKALSAILQMAEPCYVDKSGLEYAFDRAELEFVNGIVHGRGLPEPKLPIVLIADARHSQPTWRVEGEADCALVSSVLGRDSREPSSQLFLHGPHVAELRRTLPTTTACMFVP